MVRSVSYPTMPGIASQSFTPVPSYGHAEAFFTTHGAGSGPFHEW